MRSEIRENEKKVEQLREILYSSDAVLIGAGAGLSVSAGLAYSGERFHRYFADFEEKYHFHDMYSGGFYPFDSQEEYWAYFSRFILINRYMDPPGPVYLRLLKLVRDMDYFVLTTNVDHCFQRAGFDKSRLFYTQGDFGLFQCSKPCCQNTYDNETEVRKMAKEQSGMKIPARLIPLCPQCGRPMSMNLRADASFVEDEGWRLAAKRYDEFLRTHGQSKLLFLELGVGMNTPGIIKFSFWNMVNRRPDAFYACVNLKEAFAPEEIRGKSLCISADIADVLDRLWK